MKVSLLGLKPEKVNISNTEDSLIIKGVHKEEKEVKQEEYIYRERLYGAFNGSVSIPAHIRTDKAEAVFENCILTLTLYKTEET